MFLFYPLSLLTKVINYLKKIFIRPQKFNISVVCVGNIYIGEQEKHPLRYLSETFLNSGKKAAIIKKYYSSQIDEHNLIKANYENLIINLIDPKL